MPQGVIYGDYFLLGRLAHGGMAEVFLAKSMTDSPEGLLAIKRTLSQYANEEEFVNMFTDEARIASGLRHPNICRIYDHGELGDQRYLVMEFVHGKDLKVVSHRATQRREMLPQTYCAYIVSRIASALHIAHTKINDRGEPERIVHRDVSPHNILISYDGVPKLIDFGIAKAKDRLAKTQAGVVKGKFAYMSPEQAIGGDVDFRTDIFALGVVLFELLTGGLPFKGSSDFSTLKKIAKAEFEPPNTDLVPPRLAQVLQKALTRKPEDRYPTSQDMAEDLERYLADDKEISLREISSYMRRLFRDDYIREGTRIKQYLEIKPPRVAASEEGRGVGFGVDIATDEQRVPPEIAESTRITETTDLAAGYEAAETGEITGLADLLEPEPVMDPPSTLPPQEPAVDNWEEPTREMSAVEFDFRETTDERTYDDETDAEEVSNPEIIDVETVDVDTGELGGGETVDLSRVVSDVRAMMPGLPGASDASSKPRTDPPTRRESSNPRIEPRQRENSNPRIEPQRPTSSGKRASQIASSPLLMPEPARRKSTQSRRVNRRPAVFTPGELVLLACAGGLGILLVYSTYFVTNYGVPAFAQGLRPTIEAVVGEVPEYTGGEPSQEPQSPTPAPEGGAAEQG